MNFFVIKKFIEMRQGSRRHCRKKGVHVENLYRSGAYILILPIMYYIIYILFSIITLIFVSAACVSKSYCHTSFFFDWWFYAVY